MLDLNRVPGLKKIPSLYSKKTISDTVPFLDFDNNGVFEITPGFFSKSFFLQDTNYHISREEDQRAILIEWCRILNTIEPAISFQFTINVKNTDKEAFEEMITIEERGDKLDEYRNTHNEIMLSKMEEGSNTLSREKYITLGVEASDIVEANAKLTRLYNTLRDGIKSIKGAGIAPVGTTERLKIIHDIYNMGEESDFRETMFINHRETGVYSTDNIFSQGSDIREIVAPKSFKVDKTKLTINEKKVKVFYLGQALPTMLSDTLLDDICGLDANMLLTMNVSIMSQEEALKIVKHRINDISSEVIEAQKRASRSGYSPELISPTLALEQREADELLSDMQTRDQKLFKMNMILTIYAASDEEMNEYIQALKPIAAKHSVKFILLDKLQEEGYNASLPYGKNFLPDIFRTLTTESLAIFTPFWSQELVQPGGIYYGQNAVSNNIILFDRFSGDNYNGFIFGTPGSGKSFSAKMEMMEILLRQDDADVIVIDPESEYSPMASMLGGEVIDVRAGSKYHINPLDIDVAYAADDGVDPVIAKVEFIQSIIEIISGNGFPISPSIASMVDRAARNVYAEWSEAASNGATTDELEEYVPTLYDLWVELARIAEEESMTELFDVVKALELYVSGTLNVFSHKTNVQTNSRFIVYDIKDLGSKILPLGMLIMLDSIWNRICRNRKLERPTYIYIDEIYLLFKNQMAAQFLHDTWKRSRKYLGAPCGITQNVSDLLDSDIAKTMISNSSYVLMLNQFSADMQQLAVLLDLSETQCSFATNVSSGNGLLYVKPSQGSSKKRGLPGGVFPLRNAFPRNNSLYTAMSTKIRE